MNKFSQNVKVKVERSKIVGGGYSPSQNVPLPRLPEVYLFKNLLTTRRAAIHLLSGLFPNPRK